MACAPHKRRTLALRIQFNGQDALKVSNTSQDDIPSLIPWLRGTLTSLRLPHPKSSNVFKPDDTTGVIDMYWDIETAGPIVKLMINRCRAMETSTLQEGSIGVLMIFELPGYMREIPNWKHPSVVKHCPSGGLTASSGPVSTEREAALRAMFESIGLSIPTPVGDFASYVPALSAYIQTLRHVADSEAAARMKAETALAEERARHARILHDIQMECREPFVVPALLDAFVSVSHIVESTQSNWGLSMS